MYANIMKWDWGNSDDIYHILKPTGESITYRTNLARLMNQLIKEGKRRKQRR
jgi:hypothetical protein